MLLVDYSSPILCKPNLGKLIQFTNCKILLGQNIVESDLWTLDGKIIDGRKVFFDQKKYADIQVNCKGLIISPGFIDVQINGGFGIDFSSLSKKNFINGLIFVGEKLLSFGVTSFCPTIISSSSQFYHDIIPLMKFRHDQIDFNKPRANILGLHLEGPFISKVKKGAHPQTHIIDSFLPNPLNTLQKIYGTHLFDNNVNIITLAPELNGSKEIINYCSNKNIKISLGHTESTFDDSVEAIKNGANKITHLFNAMKNYHHRDPGLIGLINTPKIYENLFYGVICDGVHTHPSAIKLAYQANSDGLIIVSDAMAALGMGDGIHRLGDQIINVKDNHATVHGTNITAGSVASIPKCVKTLQNITNCPLSSALQCASLKAARLLEISDKIGDLSIIGSNGDFILIDENVNIYCTFIESVKVYECN
ncbi:Putative N-acetylglucosamine-6-phosphate deacetylase [Strongyloides ratti]|uniref:N-acetylglucosamine-6-phosphate deacetylase n=1 Tax=Strongyloides ratti TaxID=34506 RepID=A0A090MZ53_STRRB|nr:Putative N-acetylglucosamine-6-phosphate deacetylase [Strongyloides ratti]CEF68334.1 Putative N-acetylglucosamine-6-phosphate deacetylase [Strongyloides ratti]